MNEGRCGRRVYGLAVGLNEVDLGSVTESRASRIERRGRRLAVRSIVVFSPRDFDLRDPAWPDDRRQYEAAEKPTDDFVERGTDGEVGRKAVPVPVRYD